MSAILSEKTTLSFWGFVDASKGPYSLAKPKNKRSCCMSLEFCLQASLGIFTSPRAYKGDCTEYFPSSRAPRVVGKARNFSKSQGHFHMRRKLYTTTRTLSSPRKTRNFSTSQRLPHIPLYFPHISSYYFLQNFSYFLIFPSYFFSRSLMDEA